MSGENTARGALLCQYAVRETWLTKRRDYSRRGRDNNGEVEGLVEGIEPDDIERVDLRAIAGAGNADVKYADCDAGAESYACSCERADGERQPEDSVVVLCMGNRSF